MADRICTCESLPEPPDESCPIHGIDSPPDRSSSVPSGERHRIEVSTERATCCDEHTMQVAECSCGWQTTSLRSGGDLNGAILGHRVQALEEAMGQPMAIKAWGGKRPAESALGEFGA